MRILRDHRGLPVRLTSERLKHILEHPEMVELEGAIEETVASPQKVIESLSDRDTHLYYRFYTGTRAGNRYLCVVVKLSPPNSFVLTAYLTDRIKGGVPIWPREE